MTDTTTVDAVYRAQLEAAQAQDVIAARRRPGRLRATDVVRHRQRQAMLTWMRTHTGGRLSADQVARAWVWADLHLDHAEALWCFGRPFRTVEGMRRALFEAWRHAVGEQDLVICLGDVTVGPPDRALDEDLATLPGEKMLVVGNHEFVDSLAGPKDGGFGGVYPNLTCDSDPPLHLTHEPLEAVPAGGVNVHGHLHGTAARRKAARSTRHLNVNVELTSYRPVRLAELAATARALAAGDIEPRRTTARTIAAARVEIHA